MHKLRRRTTVTDYSGALLAYNENLNVVRFTADRPVTIALSLSPCHYHPATITVMMVDWEENLGLDSENNRGEAFHPGDGGFIAYIQDAHGESVAISDAYQ